MPTITLNKKVFENIVGKKLPLEKLKDRISMLGTDLEKIKGNEITVEVFPNRPDMLSEQGFARAFSSFINVKTGLKKYKVKKSGNKIIVNKSVNMRPYTACAIVKKLKFTDEKIKEIMQIQEKLALTHGRNRKKSAYGIYPLKNIKFPVSYIAKDSNKIRFKPLGFNKEILAKEIEKKHPKGREYKEITAGWKKHPFFIDAENKIMSMLPYTNSENLGKINETTKEVFIECSGTNLENVNIALNILVSMFADMGGEIYSLDIQYETKKITTPNLEPSKMKLDLKYINKKLGLELKEKEAVKLLERMGYGYKKGNALIPKYRADILHQADLMEDIAIAYGYENFEETIPNVATTGNEDSLERFKQIIRESLIGIPLLEVKNYHLMPKEKLTTKMNTDEKVIGLINSVSEHTHLRNSIIPSLLQNLSENQHHEYPQNIFEIGKTFPEKDKIAVALCHEKTDFTEIKQALDSLLQSLGIKYKIKTAEHPSYIQGRVGEIITTKVIGRIGEIHPQVLNNWDLSMPVTTFEIEIKELHGPVNQSGRLHRSQR